MPIRLNKGQLPKPKDREVLADQGLALAELERADLLAAQAAEAPHRLQMTQARARLAGQLGVQE